jgi:hypothetical protein
VNAFAETVPKSAGQWLNRRLCEFLIRCGVTVHGPGIFRNARILNSFLFKGDHMPS